MRPTSLVNITAFVAVLCLLAAPGVRANDSHVYILEDKYEHFGVETFSGDGSGDTTTTTTTAPATTTTTTKSPG